MAIDNRFLNELDRHLAPWIIAVLASPLFNFTSIQRLEKAQHDIAGNKIRLCMEVGEVNCVFRILEIGENSISVVYRRLLYGTFSREESPFHNGRTECFHPGDWLLHFLDYAKPFYANVLEAEMTTYVKKEIAQWEARHPSAYSVPEESSRVLEAITDLRCYMPHGDVRDGERHSALFGIARGLRDLGISLPSVRISLCDVNEKCCKPPIMLSEVETILSAFFGQHSTSSSESNLTP